MPSKTLGLCLVIAIGVGSVSLSHAATGADTHADTNSHEAHQQHGAIRDGLQLNNGSQWQTDAPLRKAMATLRKDIHPLMSEIHQDQLGADRYTALAVSVNDQVTYMIEHCQLEGDADAQLHLIIADLMAAANALHGKDQSQARRDGAIRVVGALNNYATYFEDESFEKLND